MWRIQQDFFFGFYLFFFLIIFYFFFFQHFLFDVHIVGYWWGNHEEFESKGKRNYWADKWPIYGGFLEFVLENLIFIKITLNRELLSIVRNHEDLIVWCNDLSFLFSFPTPELDYKKRVTLKIGWASHPTLILT